MKKRILSFVCALCLCLTLLPATALAADGPQAPEVLTSSGTAGQVDTLGGESDPPEASGGELSYLYYTSSGSTATRHEGTITEPWCSLSGSECPTNWDSETCSWYVVEGEASAASDITVTGTVNLLLKDGSKLNAKGINITQGSTLAIYAQSEGENAGALSAKSSDQDAAIHNTTGSTLIIHGGTITATGELAPGIGGAASTNLTSTNFTDDCSNGGTVTIYGGTVTATGSNGAGIGGGQAGKFQFSFSEYYYGGSGGTVTIYGGNVTARGTDAGIGNGPRSTLTGKLQGTSTGLITASLKLDTSSFTGLVKDGSTYTVYGNLSLDTLETPLSIADGENLSIRGSLSIPAGKTVTVTNAGTIDCGNGKFVNNGTLYLDHSGVVNGTFGGSGVFLIPIALPDDTDSLSVIPSSFSYTGEDYAGQIFLGTGTSQNLGGKDFLNVVRTDGWTVTYTRDDQSTDSVVDAGTYTVTFAPPEGEAITRTFTVNRAEQTIGAPQVQSQSDTWVNLSPVAASGTVEYGYSTENSAGSVVNWQESTRFDGMTSGTYYFFAKVTGDGNYTDAVSGGTPVTLKEVASIAVKKGPSKMDYATGETLDLTGLVITVTYTDQSTGDVTWSPDSGITSDPAQGAALSASQHSGKAVTVTYGGQSAATAETLTVTKSTPVVTAPAANALTYDGTAQTLVTAGSTTGGTLIYSLDEDGPFSKTIPTGINAGSYTVYYKVEGNDDYDGTNTQSVPVIISPKEVGNPTIELEGGNSFEYTGEEIKPAVTVKDGNTVIPSEEYTVEYAQNTGVGQATVTITDKDGGNYIVSGQTTFAITEQNQPTLAITGKPASVIYGETFTLSTSGGAEGGTVTWNVTDGTDVATVDENDGIVNIIGVGKFTITATKAAANYENAVATYTATAEKKQLTVTGTVIENSKEYNGSDAAAVTEDGTLNGALSIDIVRIGTVTAVYDNADVGTGKTVTVTYTLKGSNADHYTVEPNYFTADITAKDITGADITLGSTLTYNGREQTQQINSVTVDGLDVTYTTTGNTATDAGTYTLTVTGMGNFTGTATEEWSVAKASIGIMSASGYVKVGAQGTVTLPALPDGASYHTPASSGGAITDLSISGTTLTYTGGSGIQANREYTVTVQIDGGKNYENTTLTVTLTGTDKDIVTVTGVTARNGTYNGQAQAGYTGTPSAAGFEGNFSVTYNTSDQKAPTDAGNYTVTIAIPEGDKTYVGTLTLNFTIEKALLTVTAPSKTIYVGDQIPDVSALGTVTISGLKGEDVFSGVALAYGATPDNSQPGTFDIVPSGGNFTNGSLDNYDIRYQSGTLTVAAKSTGGGGGGSSTATETETTKNPDGTTTTTVTNKTTGTVTETTKFPDGSKEVVETKKDGTVTTTTTDTAGNKTQAVVNPDGSSRTTVDNKDGSGSVTLVDENGSVASSATLSQTAVEAAQAKGEAVTLPMPEVPVTADREAAPTVTVNLPADTAAKVEIPVENVTPGTVAVLVKDDGTEEVIKTSLTTDSGVAVTLSNGDTVKIVDNSQTFADVPDSYWGKAFIDFATSRGLFAGTSQTTFAPDAAMTRGMIVTVLASYDGVDTASGSTWYEAGQLWAVANGISDGTNMDGTLTREQLATMLWRYAQDKGYDTTQGGMAIREYADFDQISDYAVEAMTWAVNAGIISGTSSDTLSPQGSATRAQVATILMRFCELDK